jgi:Domain of unknown function (DUF1992)
MDVWNLIAERKIQEAMDEGAFDHLEGAGAPIPDEINPYEDPSQRMAHRLMKNAGVSPAWIIEGRELDREIEELSAEDRVGDADARRRRIAELNRRIMMFNLKTPVRSTQKRTILR